MTHYTMKCYASIHKHMKGIFKIYRLKKCKKYLQYVTIEARRKYKRLYMYLLICGKDIGRIKQKLKRLILYKDEWKRGGNKEAIRTWYRMGSL